jgi:hypothetical protein
VQECCLLLLDVLHLDGCHGVDLQHVGHADGWSLDHLQRKGMQRSSE